jgi:hypothetical protein
MFTAPRVLEELSRDKNTDIRFAVAGNLGTPADIIEYLAEKDANMSVQIQAIHNPNCPISILGRIANDSGNMGARRQAVAENENCPADIIIQLVQCEDVHIQEIALAHPNCPEHIRAMVALGE